MIGNNEFHFNESTMIEIVQYYLDNKLLNKDECSPTVKAVQRSEGFFRVLVTKESKS